MTKVWVVTERSGGGFGVLGVYGTREQAERRFREEAGGEDAQLAALAAQAQAAGLAVQLPPKAAPERWELLHETADASWWRKGASSAEVRECEVSEG